VKESKWKEYRRVPEICVIAEVSCGSIPQANDYLDLDLVAMVSGALGGEEGCVCWQLMTNDVSWVCPILHCLLPAIAGPVVAPSRNCSYVQNFWPQNSK
jgi:hypothetical protein